MDPSVFANWKFPVLAGTVAILWLAETLAPHFSEFIRAVRERRIHALRNAALALVNGLLGVAGLGALIAMAVAFAVSQNIGLVRLVEWSPMAEAIIALLLFDAWMYWWHRLNHTVGFLWRFHRVHHSDPRMDVSTALRFHPGEILLSTAARLVVVSLIGMELWHLALYELIALPVVAFHHSNIAMPRRADQILRQIIVTPWMHWVHHSRIVRETNSNYSSVLSVWDRIFGSYQINPNPDTIQFGLDEFPDTPDHQTLRALATNPIQNPERVRPDNR
jgi:sterol desaturase/sphingolipid hydroxylase (fatty acid hydroxylase superfamily)